MVLGMLPATVFAAQEIEGLELGPNVIKDPDSPTGYTVKFLYENKEASQVTFAGDIALRNDVDRSDPKIYTPFEYEPGLMRSGTFTAPMTEIEDGLWYYEVPLAAGANQYWFYVDGNTNHMVADPANAPVWSPGSPDSKDAYNAVYVPYDEKQAYEPMKAREAENPRETEKGTWSYVSMEFGGQTHYMGVYLPYGYDENRPEPYKTIYVLHGYGQDESDWMGIGSVQNIMDNLAAEGRTEPAVIVSVTSDNNFLGSGGGFFGGGSYENVEGKLLPFIEEHYNVSTKAEDRSWTGLSMGSMNTQNMINANAPLFGYYSAFSGGVSVRANAEGLDQTHIFFATGWDDATVRPDSTAWLPLKEAGYYVDYLEITAAHDFNAWCQLFRIYLEDYLWQPAAFGDVKECDHDYEAVVTEPTCTEKGFTPYTCPKCGDSYVADEVDALGHNYEEVVIKPTCTQQGYTTQSCARCGATLPIFGNITQALGHKWDEGKVSTEPTEDAEGVRTFTCTVCDEIKTEAIDKLPHAHDYKATITEPTCEDSGYTTYICSKCGDEYVADEVEALGHEWDDGVVFGPVCELGGWTTYTCLKCGYSYKDDILASVGHYFVDGRCAVCGKPLSHYTPVVPDPGLTDLPPEGHWAREGIDYCLEHKLMNGTGNNKFSPETIVTRAELVTILYRAVDAPEIAYKGTFQDVPDDQWYTEAIEWAAANKIVNGVGDGKNFAPNATITREQIAAILYRYETYKNDEITVEGNLKAFPDAANVSSFASTAMIWAIENKIITGATVDGVTYLKPLDSATREQIAAIMMRYLEAK